MGKIRLLGIGGSLRADSHTTHAIELALNAALSAGVEIDFFNIRESPLPFYDDRKAIKTYPDAVFKLLDSVRQADGLILGTPVYHGMLSGSLKNALDFLELLAEDATPWLQGKVVGLISVAGGRSGVNAINSLIHTCQTLRAWVAPTLVVIPGEAYDSTGQIADESVRGRLARLGKEVTHAAKALSLAYNKLERLM